MTTIDFTSAYRDATKGSTLKALAARRAELQAAQASARPREIKSPEQAIGSVVNTLSGAIREGRLADQEAKGRARFAKLLAGGLTPDEAGEAYGLDAETTQKWMDRNWAQEDAARQEKIHQGERTEDRGWAVDDATARVKAAQDLAAQQDEAAKKAQEAGFTHSDEAAKIAAATQSDSDLRQAALRADNPVAIDEAMQRGLLPTADGEAMKKQINDKAAADLAAKAPDQWSAVPDEVAAQYGQGSDVFKNRGQYTYNAKTREIKRVDPNQFTAAEQEKRQTDTKTKLTSIDVGLDALNRAAELAPEVTEFGAAGRAVYDVAGMLPESWTETLPNYKKTADATKRFDQIMKSSAFQALSVALAGSDSDRDVKNFLDLIADPNSTLTQKKAMISSLMNTLQKERLTQAQRLKGITGEDYGEYKYTNPDAAAGDTAAVGGGGGTDPDAVAKRKAERKAKYGIED